EPADVQALAVRAERDGRDEAGRPLRLQPEDRLLVTRRDGRLGPDRGVRQEKTEGNDAESAQLHEGTRGKDRRAIRAGRARQWGRPAPTNCSLFRGAGYCGGGRNTIPAAPGRLSSH